MPHIKALGFRVHDDLECKGLFMSPMNRWCFLKMNPICPLILGLYKFLYFPMLEIGSGMNLQPVCLYV